MARLIALTLLALAWPAAAQLSPGPLSEPHAALDHQEGCVACHERLRKQTNDLCVECHPLIQASLKARRGYHGLQARRQRCAECHQEHRGRDVSLIRWPGGARDAFAHERTGYRLEGAHADLKCEACHTRARIAEPAAFKLNRTYLGLSKVCRVCHAPENPHGGQFAPRDCDECHDQLSWTPNAASKAEAKRGAARWPSRFDHDRRFPLRGQHRDVDCEGCHPNGRFADTPNACVGCHDSGHPPQSGFGEGCADCHTDQGWSLIIFKRATHPKPLPLRNKHDLPDCMRCHGGALPRDQGCEGCHPSPHSAGFRRDCQRCHTDEGWRPTIKGRFHHDMTRFPLVGEHIKRDCEACHPKAKGGAVRLQPIAHDTCADCHQDPHGVGFERPCEGCHQPHGFRPSTFPLSDHPQWILDGAHRAVGCAACHQTGSALDFRWGAACADCHEDAHAGQFEARRCDDCHDLEGWAVPRALVQHPDWVERGAHAEAECAHCHPDGRYADTPARCEGCHGAPHLGQFIATPPKRPCDACHQVERKDWAMAPDWGHPHWPLEGAHAKAKCEACHKEVRLSDGRLAVRWRLGFRDCGRCHENVHQR
ncbi:hypothetical protein KKF91_02290 [Myxococcota bacterium]|nr:hypothetical protein [Myxococcota bacterium]MBU1429368.1 hypothetical protein [Myxococcota bacterium]MBU1899881.1 hypothetical protein [Myxococcota bacterium]